MRVTPSLKPGLVTFIDVPAGTTTSLPSAFWLYANPKNNSGDYTSSISSGNLPGDIFDASAGGVTLPNGQGGASKLGNSQQADASLTPVRSKCLGFDYTQLKSDSNFTLSAHSKLLITGDLVLTTQIDGSTVSALYGRSDGTLDLNLSTSFGLVVSHGTCRGASSRQMQSRFIGAVRILLCFPINL
ncbi:MAG: hypothetical protein QM749_13625, partial [Aquabacterium sp.]